MEHNKNIIPLAILAAGAMVAGAIYFGGSTDGQNVLANPGSATEKAQDVEKVSSQDHIRGNASAPVVIVEYSDIECPFCKVFHSTMQDVVSAYEGDVAWVYRHFPIAQLHSKATKEAEATECAAEQGGNTAFWNYLDQVFEATSSNDSLDLAELPLIAGNLGLDVESFNECLSSGRYTEKVEKSVEKAVKAGARGTPYSVILVDGKVSGIINGAEPLSSVRTKIDAVLR